MTFWHYIRPICSFLPLNAPWLITLWILLSYRSIPRSDSFYTKESIGQDQISLFICGDPSTTIKFSLMSNGSNSIRRVRFNVIHEKPFPCSPWDWLPSSYQNGVIFPKKCWIKVNLLCQFNKLFEIPCSVMTLVRISFYVGIPPQPSNTPWWVMVWILSGSSVSESMWYMRNLFLYSPWVWLCSSIRMVSFFPKNVE